MSTQAMFVLYNSSGRNCEICDVFSSIELAEKTMNDIVRTYAIEAKNLDFSLKIRP